ncbi:hypothetical protein C8F04DRAFT_182028 [Mycena alexandri]|uniref:Uncharacterized protein n=1 Tax=Mycena alexandri TaxID=1745969 RepID=A0AAD6SBX4_9AGAR|nr:hypothetical protein C8F04DRAFT_182028 [Mycena alexandri]
MSDLNEISSAIIICYISLNRDTLALFLYQLRTPSDGDPPHSLQLVEADIILNVKFEVGCPDITFSISDSWPVISTSLLELYHHTRDSGTSNSTNQAIDVPSLILMFIAAVLNWPDMAPYFCTSRQLEEVMSILVGIWTSEGESKMNGCFPRAVGLCSARACKRRVGTTRIQIIGFFIAHLDTNHHTAPILSPTQHSLDH